MMKRLLVMYGAIHVNVLLVSLYLVGWLNGAWLPVLQVTFLALLLWGWKRFKIPKRNLSLKERGLWLLGSLGVMVSIVFLLNASVVEEVFYREVLWGVLPQPVVQVLLTSSLFALAHHPSSLFTWVLYGSLGLTLGVARGQTDCLSSTLVHLSWNGIVFFLSLL